MANASKAPASGLVTWRGVATSQDAEAIRQDCCQLIFRRLYAKFVHGKADNGLAAMVCAIIARIHNKILCPRGELAEHLGFLPARVSLMLGNGVWPKRSLSVFHTFEKAVRFMILGAVPESSPTILDDSKKLDAVIKEKICNEIIRYFFPEGDPRDQSLPPYFRVERRSWNAPYDKYELTQAVKWLRREVRLGGKWGTFLVVLPNGETGSEFLSGKFGYELSRASLEEKALHVAVVYPNNILSINILAGELRKKVEADIRPPRAIRGLGITLIKRPISDPLFSPILAFALLAYQTSASLAETRLFLLRPYADEHMESVTPFAVPGNDAELDKFLFLLRKSQIALDFDVGGIQLTVPLDFVV